MSSVSITFDKRALKGLFGSELKRQLRFATAQTLTQVAWDSRAAVQKMLHRRLDIKKTFLPKSVIVVKATKQHLESVVGFMDRAKLAELLEEGGRRRPVGSRNIAVPQAARTKTGRVTKSRRPAALLAKGAFIATINGTKGIWMKIGRGKNTKIRLMYSLERSTKYDKGTIRFHRTVQGIVPASFKKRLGRNLENAIRNRRR